MPTSWSKCLPIRLWPLADRAAWEAAVRPSNPFESGGGASHWSHATKRKTAVGYGRYLCWLRERGELDETADSATRITRERLAAYLDELRRTNRGHTIQTRIQELGDAMQALAPNSDWRFIKRAAGRLRANTHPARDKRGRLPRIVDPIAQGYWMMEEAEETASLSGLGRAALYRDGLLLVFLAYHPLRLRNLASLRIGQHLLVQEDRIILKVEASETKGRTCIEQELSPRLSLAVRSQGTPAGPGALACASRGHALGLARRFALQRTDLSEHRRKALSRAERPADLAASLPKHGRDVGIDRGARVGRSHTGHFDPPLAPDWRAVLQSCNQP